MRTWVNGELVQDDTTAGLIFPFAQIVADLSQLMTLEPGDVILTGTPAGSSVIVPGDVVEVEVSDEAAGLSTGRLSTTVTQGDAEFAAFGNTAQVDDQQPDRCLRLQRRSRRPGPGSRPARSALTAHPELQAKLDASPPPPSPARCASAA